MPWNRWMILLFGICSVTGFAQWTDPQTLLSQHAALEKWRMGELVLLMDLPSPLGDWLGARGDMPVSEWVTEGYNLFSDNEVEARDLYRAFEPLLEEHTPLELLSLLDGEEVPPAVKRWVYGRAYALLWSRLLESEPCDLSDEQWVLLLSHAPYAEFLVLRRAIWQCRGRKVDQDRWQQWIKLLGSVTDRNTLIAEHMYGAADARFRWLDMLLQKQDARDVLLALQQRYPGEKARWDALESMRYRKEKLLQEIDHLALSQMKELLPVLQQLFQVFRGIERVLEEEGRIPKEDWDVIRSALEECLLTVTIRDRSKGVLAYIFERANEPLDVLAAQFYLPPMEYVFFLLQPRNAWLISELAPRGFDPLVDYLLIQSDIPPLNARMLAPVIEDLSARERFRELAALARKLKAALPTPMVYEWSLYLLARDQVYRGDFSGALETLAELDINEGSQVFPAEVMDTLRLQAMYLSGNYGRMWDLAWSLYVAEPDGFELELLKEAANAQNLDYTYNYFMRLRSLSGR